MSETTALYAAFAGHIATALDAAGALPAGLSRAAITLGPPRDAADELVVLRNRY